MSQTQTVMEAKPRDTRGTAAARKLRREGLVPAVIYGHKLTTVPISLPEKEFTAVLRSGSHMVDVKIGDSQEKALIKELQYDPISLRLLHVDLARVALDEKVVIAVPLQTSGTAKGASEGGVLDLIMKELEVECLPTSIPNEIKIKVGDMVIGDTIYVRDIQLPDGVVPSENVDPEAIVVMVHAPRKGLEEEAEAVAEVEAPPEPEVIGAKEREERAEAKAEQEKE